MRSLAFFVCVLFVSNGLFAEHPFLIVKKDMYQELQDRSDNFPWNNIKEEAQSLFTISEYNPDDDFTARIRQMKAVMRSGSLLYILENDNETLRTQIKDKLRDHLLRWDEIYTDPVKDAGNHFYVVDGGTAFFNSVLALDIIHDDLTTEELADIEDDMALMAEWYRTDGSQSWSTNGYGCQTIWALYIGDAEWLDSAKESYKSEFYSLLTNEGVYKDASGYAKSRTGSSRDAKCYTIDVLEFTNTDNTFYTDPKLITLFEWLYQSSFSPMQTALTFGDSVIDDGTWINYMGPRAYSAHKFSPLAREYAAWHLSKRGHSYKGYLLYYVLNDETLPVPKKPNSRIYPSAYASFWEESDSTEALAGFISSMGDAPNKGHAHKDVNAIHICAYGEHVLRNSGYAGFNQGIDIDGDGIEEFSWNWLHSTARSSNTVGIDDTDHVSKIGGGLDEGFVSEKFDYVSASSGAALPNGAHQRNFCFVHPQDNKIGYFILFDEVSAAPANGKATISLHPHSSDYQTTSVDEEYVWNIQDRKATSTLFTIYLGTEPSLSTEILDGGLGDDKGKSIIGKYLASHYQIDDNGFLNAVTLLVPHDAAHPKPTMTRVSSTGFTGARVDHGDGILDTAIESSGTQDHTHESVVFNAQATHYRQDNGVLSFYFVRQGTKFDDGLFPHRGFHSNKAVSIHIKDTQGQLTCAEDVEVTFYHPGISSVLVDGVTAPIIATGTNLVQVSITSGNHSIEFVTNP